jgi:4-aminobutyrate aminotransferase-like enzyme
LLERGYITLPAGNDARVVSLTPPLTIGEALLETFLDALDEALDEVLA